MADLIASLNDAHVSSEHPSTLTYTLPLEFMRQEDGPNHTKKIIVNYVEKTEGSLQRMPDTGDELLSINGQSPDQFQKSTPLFDAAGNPITNQTLFALNIARLREGRGIPLGTKFVNPNVVLEFRSAKDGSVFKTNLRYDINGIGLIGSGVNGNPNPRVMFPKKDSKPLLGSKDKAFTDLAPATFKMLSQFDTLLKAEVPLEKKQAKEDSASAQKGKTTSEGKKVVLGDTKPYFELPKDFEEITPPDFIPGFMTGMNFKKLLNGDFLFAGKFNKNGKTVGFLRIPSYTPKNLPTILHSLRYYIGRLQAETDYLVIDQTRNPGGMVVFSDLLVKSLVGTLDKNVHMKFAVKPTESFVRQFIEMYNDVLKNSDQLFKKEEIKAFAPLIRAEYEKIKYARDHRLELSEPINFSLITLYFETALDRTFLKQLSTTLDSTNPQQPNTLPKSNDASFKEAQRLLEKNKHLFGNSATVNEFNPAQLTPELQKLLHTFAMIKNFEKLVGVSILEPIMYTKPVVALIDQLDFSGGDATMALLQDYNRAILVGVGSNRTAGAGGTVERKEFNGLLQVAINMTTSLMIRPNGRLVENYGVTTENYVPVLVKDYQDGFQNLFDRIMSEVERVFPQAEAQAKELVKKFGN